MRNSIIILLILVLSLALWSQNLPSGDELLGTHSYDDFEKPEACYSCHVDIYMQWKQAMMSQAYTHHWDEIEYFDLAVEHAKNDPSFKGPVDGCNGCHTPMAFMAGDVTPPRPSENSRANESVNCDVCHTITGWKGDEPFNFSFQSDPGRTKYGTKPGLVSPHHETKEKELYGKSEYCGNCHNEKNPFGIWVKSTQLEWAEGPYAEQGVQCQDCHMPKALGKNAKMAEEDMVAQHLFHGAHDPGKLAGAIEMRVHPQERELEYDGTVVLQVQLFNGKCGHKVPSGSVEDRIMWLHVTAKDSEGNEYHLPVDKKGFDGEHFTIGSDELAYTDMGIAQNKPDFKGVQRDGIPIGDRIFRMPFLDKDGVMTIMQWNTASLGVDYRIGPRETKIESFTWQLPDDIPLGKVTFHAQLNYQRLVQPVAEYLNVPEDEYKIELINTAETWVQVYD